MFWAGLFLVCLFLLAILWTASRPESQAGPESGVSLLNWDDLF